MKPSVDQLVQKMQEYLKNAMDCEVPTYFSFEKNYTLKASL
jgi:hypothetical protein